MTSVVNKIGLLTKAKAEADKAATALEALASNIFPPGSCITWKRAGHTHRGHVKYWSYGSCWAESMRTGKEWKISITDILAVQQ